MAARRLPGSVLAPLPFDQAGEGGERVLHVGAQRDLRRVVLAHLPVAEADLDQCHAAWHRVGLTEYGHAQHVRSDAEHEVVGREGLADVSLVAGERPHEGRMLGEEVRPRRTPSADTPARPRSSAQRAASARALAVAIFVSGHDDRALRRKQPVGEAIERRIARAPGSVDARWLAEFERILLVQNVAGERDEHRAGRRGSSPPSRARRTMRGRSRSRVTSTAHFTRGCAIGSSGA